MLWTDEALFLAAAGRASLLPSSPSSPESWSSHQQQAKEGGGSRELSSPWPGSPDPDNILDHQVNPSPHSALRNRLSTLATKVSEILFFFFFLVLFFKISKMTSLKGSSHHHQQHPGHSEPSQSEPN